MWPFSKKQLRTLWLILIVGLRTMETFWSVILLNRSLSTTCIMWVNVHWTRSLKTQIFKSIKKQQFSVIFYLLQVGNWFNNSFIPSILFCGAGLADTSSNLGVNPSVKTGLGSSRRNCLKTLATTAGSYAFRSIIWFRSGRELKAFLSLVTLDFTPEER